MDVLRDWQDAPALVLSCPGPMRRHKAALLPLENIALPQVFLGGESQLLAFAAASPGMAGRLFFAPLPEMFSDPVSLRAAWAAVGRPVPPASELGHLRFGSVRDARILKAACNAAVVAEARSAPPITASHHPFASGQVLPAAMQRVFVYGPQTLHPPPLGGPPLPATILTDIYATADLDGAPPGKPPRGTRPSGRGTRPSGLDLVWLPDYEPDAWASGELPSRAGAPAPADHAILLPWNLAHFGSIVPELLRRLAALHQDEAARPAILILPFNYLGLTGTIRRLIKEVRDAAARPDQVLATIGLARVSRLSGLAELKRLARTAWVDGNDPEHWWTLARLATAGFDPILLDPRATQADASRFPADDPIRVDAATRFGTLSSDVSLPSPRALPKLLDHSFAQKKAGPGRPRPGGGPGGKPPAFPRRGAQG